MNHTKKTLCNLLNASITEGSILFKDTGGNILIGQKLSDETVVLRINDPAFYSNVLAYGNLGLGESYMYKYFEMEKGTLEDLLSVLLNNDLDKKLKMNLSLLFRYSLIRIKGLLTRQWTNVQKHYDTGNDLFESFLDSSLSYSCGYVCAEDDTSETLQQNKFERICQKLELKKGDHILDIGCGYGGFLMYAATHYGVTGLGVTNSKEHCAVANTRIKELKIDNLQVDLLDFKNIKGNYDKIISIGMLEHVPRSQYPIYFKTIKNALRGDGKGLVHAVGANSYVNRHDPFIQKYVFPDSNQPRLSEISDSLEKHDLFIQDVENMIRHYGYTAQAWVNKFRVNVSSLRKNYADEFLRMWEYYLCCCVAAAKLSDSALYQVLFMNDHKSFIPLKRV